MRRRVNAGRAGPESLRLARKNILIWFTKKEGLRQMCSQASDRKLIRQFSLTVFSINIVTAVVETTFSTIKNQKNIKRQSLSDDSATTALNCSMYPDVVGSTADSTFQPLVFPTLNLNDCFSYDYSCHHGVVHSDTDASDTDSDTHSNTDVGSESN